MSGEARTIDIGGETVEDKVDLILEKLEAFETRLDELFEKIENISLPGVDYRVSDY